MKKMILFFVTLSTMTLHAQQDDATNPCVNSESSYRKSSKSYLKSLGAKVTKVEFAGGTELLGGGTWIYAVRGQAVEHDGSMVSFLDIAQCEIESQKYKRIMSNVTPQ